MRQLIKKIVEYLPSPIRPNYRPRRGHYASGNQTCLRDQYWAWNKEPETNTTDFAGAAKMAIGSAIEDGLVNSVLSKLHIKGYHLLDTQVPVGGSNPNWDGYMDAFMAERGKLGEMTPFVLEIKTKSGYGANMFYENPTPDKSYMIQLGLYLKNAYEQKKITHGAFLYVLLSDAHFGTMVQVNCVYNPELQTVTAYDFEDSDGRTGALGFEVDLLEALARWDKLNEHIEKKEVPPGEYRYRYPINVDSLKNMSDTALKKLIDGVASPGDWQVRYSRYKDKQLAIDQISAEITEEERMLARQEYRRRHPRSKI